MYLHFLTLLAADITITDIFKYISDGGVVGLLLMILIGGFRRWWVWGYQLVEAEARVAKTEKERDDWRDLALQGTSIAERTVDLFKRSRGN